MQSPAKMNYLAGENKEMYIEFVRNLLLQSEASREQERLGELEANG